MRGEFLKPARFAIKLEESSVSTRGIGLIPLIAEPWYTQFPEEINFWNFCYLRFIQFLPVL
jgi:hypothetical protein